ncbi:MAG: PDZ domain-containing protein [Sulfurimonas sp.]|nr:PDZ domain-containing protein [Sulfurimonas sp.]MBU1217288.1 PDZ domain-containing protein [bacterium]MBU1434074.1 PDZ domain-containing protein [bacterium]MBU1503055.1 PDZ domain-containing protein [bacterium]MBU3938804.1 PDZ domain-containing protein [bacterium]
MFRLFIALNLLFINLYACKGGYDSCKQKVLDSQTLRECSIYIPVTKHQRVVYTTTPPKEKILKYDPFLSLYLIEDTKGFPYPFRINVQEQLGIASVSLKNPVEGKIIKRQIGLNSLAQFSEPILYPSVITSSCCSLEAIVTPQGIIEKEYIQRFINTKDVSYGDVGIRVKEEKGKVFVSAVNPFIKNNPFKKGDVLLSFADKKVSSAATFMRQILFAKIGSIQKFKVKRDGKTQAFTAVTYKRHGGGCISDTFLEEKGLYFDKQLQIIDLKKDFANYGLCLGDKLIEVNGVAVKTQEDLQKYLADSKVFSSLLLEREGFQFFVNIE